MSLRTLRSHDLQLQSVRLVECRIVLQNLDSSSRSDSSVTAIAKLLCLWKLRLSGTLNLCTILCCSRPCTVSEVRDRISAFLAACWLLPCRFVAGACSLCVSCSSLAAPGQLSTPESPAQKVSLPPSLLSCDRILRSCCMLVALLLLCCRCPAVPLCLLQPLGFASTYRPM